VLTVSRGTTAQPRRRRTTLTGWKQKNIAGIVTSIQCIEKPGRGWQGGKNG